MRILGRKLGQTNVAGTMGIVTRLINQIKHKNRYSLSSCHLHAIIMLSACYHHVIIIVRCVFLSSSLRPSSHLCAPSAAAVAGRSRFEERHVQPGAWRGMIPPSLNYEELIMRERYIIYVYIRDCI